MTPPDAHRDVGVRTMMLVDTPRILGYRFWTGPDRYRVILPVLSYEFQVGIHGTGPELTPWIPGIHPGDVMMFIMMFIMMIS